MDKKTKITDEKIIEDPLEDLETAKKDTEKSESKSVWTDKFRKILEKGPNEKDTLSVPGSRKDSDDSTSKISDKDKVISSPLQKSDTKKPASKFSQLVKETLVQNTNNKSEEESKVNRQPDEGNSTSSMHLSFKKGDSIQVKKFSCLRN
jgi:hypothetical protein